MESGWGSRRSLLFPFLLLWSRLRCGLLPVGCCWEEGVGAGGLDVSPPYPDASDVSHVGVGQRRGREPEVGGLGSCYSGGGGDTCAIYCVGGGGWGRRPWLIFLPWRSGRPPLPRRHCLHQRMGREEGAGRRPPSSPLRSHRWQRTPAWGTRLWGLGARSRLFWSQRQALRGRRLLLLAGSRTPSPQEDGCVLASTSSRRWMICSSGAL